MISNYLQTLDMRALLSKVEKNSKFFRGIFTHILFALIILTSLTLISVTALANTVITNTVTANYTTNGNNLNLSDTVQFMKDAVVVPTDTIELSKTSNVAAALIGDSIIYTLTVRNPNPRDLTNVSIEDILPLGLMYQPNSATLNNIAINSSEITVSGNTLNINIGTIPADTSWNVRYQVNIGNNAPEGNTVNKASVSSDTATSPQAQANVVVSKPIVIVPLALTKTANIQEVNIGETITYSLSIQSNNIVPISNAQVIDVLPAGTSFVVGSATYNGNPITASVNNGITFNLGDFAENSTASLIYDVVVNQVVNNERQLVNTANVTADDTQANSNIASATVNVVNDALALTKTTTSTNVTAGDVADYMVTLTNPLARDLTNLVIKDTLPTGFSYKNNTAQVNNVALAASNIATNNNVVDFTIGTLASLESISLTYQVNVEENASAGDNINVAQAISDFANSASASATVKVRTPSTINFLKIDDAGINSIIQATSYNTNQSGGQNFEEITNVTLPDGTTISLPMTQPIIDAIQYTLADPIVIEVIDLDQNLDSSELDAIEVTIMVPGTNDTEILLLTETTPNSGIFRGIISTTATGSTNIQDGVLTVAEGANINVTYRDVEDVSDTSATAALIVPNLQLQIEKSADKDFSAIGELVRYNIEFRNTTGSELANLTLNDLLPVGFKYIPNTIKFNGTPLTNNVNFNGRSLTINLNNMPAATVWNIEYVTKISAGVQFGDAVNTAYIQSGTLRSNDATATVRINDDLMRSTNLLTGRVYIGCKTGTKNTKKAPKVLNEARIYMETGRSVLTDAEGFWHLEGVQPGAHVLQLDTESIPGYEPLLCNDNTRHAGDAKSHFVNLQAGNIWHVNFHVKPIEGYQAEHETKPEKNVTTDPTKLFDDKYLSTASEGFEILWPKHNYVPAVASTKIFIKHPPKQKVEVFLNGEKVNPLNYDGSDTNKARTVTIRRWFGVDIDINKKSNTLVAVLKDQAGNEISRKTHNIHFSSKPASAKLIKEKSVLIADGKTTPVITLQVRDEEGFPMRANTHGYFTIENNQYSVKTQNTYEAEFKALNNSLSGSYKYQIEENGIARIELNPTTQAGQIKLNLQFNTSNTSKKTTEISAWLKPALREWIMVGIAEGTLAHRKLTGNMQTLKDLNKSDKYSKRGRIAFFAKGQIKGKYLLTIAYDTHKHNREIGSQLNGNIDPDAFYSIYADNSNSQYEAPSSEKLYLKLEKDNYYALFGDYQTDMTITELAKYQRTLNGFKTEYHGERINFKGFISETSNNHHHEEIPGDGTSGLYQLSNSIIPNSETIVIETRDRFHSDRIVERRELRRYQDYNIDYDTGSLFFKFPITSRDRDFNPNIIVVDYDSEGDTNKAITAGGRVSVKSKDGKLEAGLSLIHEGNSNIKDNQLIASDISYKITPDTELKVEVAQSKTEASDFEKRTAYILELEKEIENMEARIYLKKQEADFGIDSQASENGTEKIGAELDYRINEDTSVNSEITFEKNLENNNKRRLAQVELVKEFNQYKFNVGYRHSQEDLIGDNNTLQRIDSDSVLLGGQYTTKNNRVTLRTDIEKSISAENGSELSPDRIILGADVKLAQGFSVFAEHETTDNGNIKTHNNRVGLSKNLWKGAKARTTYTQENSNEGQRNYATLGLSQTVQLSEKISADFTIDQAKTIGDSTTQLQFNEDSPSISGAQRDDFTAYSVGLGSNDKDWSWTSRAEYRNGDITDKVNFLASVIRHYDNGKNLSAKLSYYNSDNKNGDFDENIQLSFGSAWHPKEKDFVFFSRLDLVSDNASASTFDNTNAIISTNDTDTQKIIHNMHYYRSINKKTQLGIHHGIKYVRDENNEINSSATIDTATVEVRRDINKNWDIGAHAGYLRDWTNDATDYVAGVSVGASPKENIWIELGYNIEGFDDDDFDNNNFTSEGVYLNFRYKFNQDSLKGNIRNFLRRRNRP